MHDCKVTVVDAAADSKDPKQAMHTVCGLSEKKSIEISKLPTTFYGQLDNRHDVLYNKLHQIHLF